jgi:hypothetical protein
MPDFKKGTGYKMKGINFGEGTGGSGMGGVHKAEIEKQNLVSEIGKEPIDHLKDSTPEEREHTKHTEKSEGSIEKQKKRQKRNEKKKNKAFLKSQNEASVKRSDLDAKGKALYDKHNK